MEILLIFGLCILAFLAFELSNKDIISPWFISCLSFLAASFFLALVVTKWGVEIHVNTIVCILSALVLFGMGEITAKLLWNRAGYKSVQYYNGNNSYVPVGGLKLGIALLIETGMLILYIFRSFMLVREAWGSTGLSETMVYLRYLLVHTDASLGSVGIICYYIGFAICLIATYILVNHLLVKRKWEKKNFLLAGMILEGFVLMFFSASRYVFIIYLVAVVIIYVNQLRATGSTRKVVNSKSGKYAVMLGVLGICLFFFIGAFVGKNSLNIFEAVASYVASPIAALDEFINRDFQISHTFGEETLLGIRSLLDRLGFGVGSKSRILEFIHFGNGNSYTTNVYTSLRRYLHDFGFWGMCIIQYFFGFSYYLLYMLSFKKRKSVFAVIYAYLNYKLVLQFFDEEFLTTFLSVDEILTVVCLLIVYFILCSPLLKRKQEK